MASTIMRWRAVMVGLMAAIVGVLTLPSPAAAQEKTIKFGALLTLSGPLAAAGREIRDGIDLAVMELNARGGVRGVGRIEIAYGDSQAKPDVANSETERLVSQENVLAVIDMYPSVTTLSASQAAERLKTPFYAAIAVADNITERGFRYVFQQVPKAASLAQFQVDFLDYLGRSKARCSAASPSCMRTATTANQFRAMLRPCSSSAVTR